MKLSPCAGMQSISDRRRNCSMERREKPQIMMTSILMKSMSFFLLPRDSVSDQFLSMEIIPTFFLLESSSSSACVYFRTACFKQKIKEADVVSSSAESKWHLRHNKHPLLNMELFKAQKLSWMQFWKTKGILQTHSLRLLFTFATVWEEIVWEILYGIESIMSRLLLSHIPGSWILLVLLIILLETPLDFIVFLDTYSCCKTKKTN